MKRIRDPDDRLLTRAEVAEIFQVAPSTVTRWAEAGKLPSVKTLGGHHRYEAKVVMELAQHFIKQETSMEKTFISVPAMYGDRSETLDSPFWLCPEPSQERADFFLLHRQPEDD